MKNINDAFKEFKDNGHERLYELLKDKKYDNEIGCQKIAYAMYVIPELIEKIYMDCLPSLFNDNLSQENFINALDDVKFNFNEIRQLIETAKLTGLKYWDDDENEESS